MMVSSGMLWARKSCQVLYCSKVSQSRDWTEGRGGQGSEVRTQWESRCVFLLVCVCVLLRMLSTESFLNITRFPIIT